MKWTKSLLSPVLAFLAACATPVFGAEDPPQQANPPVTDTATTGSTTATNKTPLVVQNPDGSITIQKEPAKTAGTDPKAKKGLVIHPQVIVPTAPAPEKK